MESPYTNRIPPVPCLRSVVSTPIEALQGGSLMESQTEPGKVLFGVAEGTTGSPLDVMGPIVEFLTSPQAAHGDFCVFKGLMPPGVVVPLHSHDETEAFFVLSGTKQVLTLDSGPARWVTVRAGDYIHVPRGTRHAHRNLSDEPVIELVVTTARLGTWFEEVGVPSTGTPQRPTAHDLQRLLTVSERYGYWLGTPEENAAIGLSLPEITGSQTGS